MKYLTVVIILLSGCCSGNPDNNAVGVVSPPAKTNTAEITPPITPAIPPPPVQRLDTWNSHEEMDIASGKMLRVRRILSSNYVELGFPYQGMQKGQLTVRDHPRFGTDVFFAIQRGQIVSCGHYRDGITVRFDNAVKTWRCENGADGSNDIAFFNKTTDFLRYLQKAEVTVITMSIFQEGERSFEFNTKGFVPYETKQDRPRTVSRDRYEEPLTHTEQEYGLSPTSYLGGEE